MKKILSALSILALLASFAACDPIDKKTPAPETPTTETPDNGETPGEGETPGTGENPGDDTPVTPPAPTKTLTLTVDFSAWPFQEDAVTAKTTTDADGNEYTFVHDGENYKFTIINTVLDGSCKGFYWRSSTQGIQGNDSVAGGVAGDFEVKFPAVADMKLTSVAVSVANAEANKKLIKILNAGGGTVVSDHVYKENSPKVFEIPEPVVNSSYSLTSGGKNIQLLGLILTYTN